MWYSGKSVAVWRGAPACRRVWLRRPTNSGRRRQRLIGGLRRPIRYAVRARDNKIHTAKPLGNPATQRQEAKGRKPYARPPARYGVFIGKDIERYLTQSRVLGNRTLRRLRLMRSPDIWMARRLSSSGCRGYNICFGTAVGNPASQSQRLRRLCARLVRPPGIFASARRKGNPFASAALRLRV